MKRGMNAVCCDQPEICPSMRMPRDVRSSAFGSGIILDDPVSGIAIVKPY